VSARQNPPLAAVPEPADLPADVTLKPPAPARPRQVTRAKLITCGGIVTVLLGWRYAAGHHPGHSLLGHAVWFLVWDAVLTGLLLWVVTGFKHRRYRHRAGRQYTHARIAGAGAVAVARARFQQYRDGDQQQQEPQGPVPVVDDGRYVIPDKPGARAGGGHRAPRRPAATAPAGSAPSVWRHAARLLTDVDGEKGPVVLARIIGTAQGLKLVADGLDELHRHLTVDRGYDERAMPSLSAASEDLAEARATLANIGPEITDFYGHLFDAADEGKQAPHDGHEMEED
jgi:hypothetical protein